MSMPISAMRASARYGPTPGIGSSCATALAHGRNRFSFTHIAVLTDGISGTCGLNSSQTFWEFAGKRLQKRCAAG